MREIASIEINKAVGELKEKLSNSRMRKFYDLGNDSFRFLFYKKEGSIHIFCKLLQTFNETKFTEGAEEATQFAMAVRKRLENATLTGIKQQGSDRIVILEFGKEGYRIIIEMLGKGNLVLVNDQNRIEACYRVARYRDRVIAPKSSYDFPKSESVSFDDLDDSAIEKILREAPADKKLIRYLSDRINVGPLYLEDMIIRSGMDPREALKVGMEESLKKEILVFFERARNERPRIYREDGRMKDYAIVAVVRYKDLESIEYDNLNELLDELYINERREKVDKEKVEAKEKIESNIRSQKELVVRMKAESEYYKKAANRIFENMQALNSLIDYLQKHRNAGLEELRGSFAGLRIKELSLKDKVVKIEMQD